MIVGQYETEGAALTSDDWVEQPHRPAKDYD
jgi:hypothetical protein